jgi:hypothetical protein
MVYDRKSGEFRFHLSAASPQDLELARAVLFCAERVLFCPIGDVGDDADDTDEGNSGEISEAAGDFQESAGSDAGTPVERSDAGSPSPEAAEPAKDTDQAVRGHYKGRNFIIAAITPDGRLYQMEHISRVRGRRGGRGFCVVEVSENGDFHLRNGVGFPTLGASKEAAINTFRAWGKTLGYEILG